MRIIKASAEILDDINEKDMLEKIERAGRVCYKSESRIKDGSSEKFVRSLIERGHESVLEHVSFSVRFICDRGVSHELVRHRIASYSQESTRYCNYSKDDFGSQITFIQPAWLDVADQKAFNIFEEACEQAEYAYFAMLNDADRTAQEARAVLPNSLKTEIIMTANVRQWRHFLKLRTSTAAHPDMRYVANQLLFQLVGVSGVLFGDLLKGWGKG